MKKKSIITFLIISVILLNFLIPKTIYAAAPKEESFFSDEITWEWEYFSEDETDTMAYGIYIPSNAEKFVEIPMIVHLHGWNGMAPDEKGIRYTGLPGVLEKWELENFSAYVVCPRNPRSDGSWTVTESVNKIRDLIDSITEEYNVDPDNIVIAGESRGATGALGLAYQLPDYFSKCVSFSGYYNGPFNTSIDTVCFYSWIADEDSKKYAPYWRAAFGAENVFEYGGGHGSVGYEAATDDTGQYVRE